MFKFISQFLLKFKKNYIVALALTLIAIFFSILIPQITNVIIDFIFNFTSLSYEKLNFLSRFLVSGWLGNPQTMTLFINLCLLFLAFATIKALLKFCGAYGFNYVGTKITGLARRKGFAKLDTRLSKTSGETFIILTNDINNMRDAFIWHFPSMIENVLLAFIGLVFTFLINIYVGILLACLIVIIGVIESFYMKESLSHFEKTRQAEGELNYFTKKNTESIKDIKVFGVQDLINSEFDKTNNEYLNAKTSSMRVVNKFQTVVNLVKGFAYGSAIVLAGLLALEGNLSIGGFVTIITYVSISLEAIISFSNSYTNFLECKIGIDRFKDFLEQKNIFQDTEIVTLTNMKPNIYFNNVTVKFGKRYIFKNIYFDIPYGETFGIYCLQGEGKTVIFNLLLHLIEQESGEIMFNEENMHIYTFESVRKVFSFASQEPFIFNDTISGNIVFYDKYNEKKFNNITENLGLGEYINKQKNKRNEVITENGYEIPSQEKQLIGIARAIYRDAPILLLDNPVYKFGQEKANDILTNIFDMYKNRTVVIASTRASDLKLCDRIIVLKSGVIVEQGTYDELISLNGEYANAVENKD